MWHGYLAIENLNLNSTQRQTFVDELRNLGPASDPQPARLNHWRTRLDDEAVIFEALFNESNLTVAKFKQRLADIFGVDESTIDHSAQQQVFETLSTPIVTFSRAGTNYIRFAAFGGIGATWFESRLETLAYLKDNSDDWEPAEI